jgi:hypothetical protein
MLDVSVVTPTYNESESICTITPFICEVLRIVGISRTEEGAVRGLFEEELCSEG